MQVQGKVVNAREKNGVSKAGKPYTIHYITVDDGNGQQLEVNTGFRQAHFMGDDVSLTLQKARFGNDWELSKGGAPTGGAAPANSNAAPAPRAMGKTFPLNADHPDNVIVRQNALAHATAIVLKNSSGSVETDLQTVKEVAMNITKWATGREDRDSLINSIGNANEAA